MIEEKIKDDILMMTNTENEVFSSLNANSKGAKRMRMTDSTDMEQVMEDLQQVKPGTSSCQNSSLKTLIHQVR